MICTFYSYKGGVGRSMALANVAEWLYCQGLRVVMIDWDLEAPGLESYFYQSPEDLEAARSQLGVIDMLMAYKRMYPRLPLPRPSGQVSAGPAGDDLAETLAVLQEHIPSITPMLHSIHAPDPASSDGSGAALWLLPAGWRSGDRFATYAQAVQDFNWSEFYAAYKGEAYFEWLRLQLTAGELADVVLIDSRTGVTEMSGVCTRQLADVVVSFCAPNLQNLNGIEEMAWSFIRPEITAKRGRKIEVVMVPARLDVSELDARNSFEKEFRARLDRFTPTAFGTVQSTFWNLAIQYIPKYAYVEKLTVNTVDAARELEEAYKKLAAHLVLLATGDSGVRVRRKYAAELQRVFGTLLPSLVISYADEEGKRVADELRRRLLDYGVSAWPELPSAGDAQDWRRQLTGLLDQSKSLVIIVTPQAWSCEDLRRQWHYARQQGIAVFLVTPGEAAAKARQGPWPRWMESHHYHLSQEWEMLVRLLQSPPQVARVPFMAPDLPPYYVERREEMNRLKEALLAGGSESRAGDIGLWGPRGCGKGTLAAIFCHDEDAIAHFSDGILWTTLGPEPHVLVELTKLYAALTGERPRFLEEEDATEQLAQRLGERNCLLVIEDVWNMQHLKPFLLGGSQCKRLILTCNLSILTNISAEVVSLGAITPEEAIALLTVRLNLSPAEATLFTPFTERLGRWPLALRLANAQLRKLLSQGVAVKGALEYLNQALDKLGVLAFDEPNVSDNDVSVSRSLALTLNQLAEGERERYLQIAFLSESKAVTSATLSEHWRLDEFETSKLLERFADLALLKYDLCAQTVRLDGWLRDYILSPAAGYDLNSRYEAAFHQLSPEDQAIVRRIFTRLVRLALPNEKAGDTLMTARVSEFNPAEQKVLPTLMTMRLIGQDAAAGEGVVQLAGEEVLRNWARLQSWLNEDHEFLLWRQSLGRSLAEWEEHRDRGTLLSGAPLHIATQYQRQRPLDLNQAEHDYINASQEAEHTQEAERQHYRQLQRTRRKVLVFVVFGTTVLVLLVGQVLYRWEGQRAGEKLSQAVSLTAEGRYLAGERRFDEAIAKFDLAIKLRPDYPETYLSLGKAMQEKGDIDKAIEAYNRVLALVRNDSAVYASRGQLYATKGDFQNALADYNAAINLEPGNPNLYFARSRVYQSLKQEDLAQKDLEKAKTLK